MKKITPLLLLLALVFMMTNCQKDTTEEQLILQDEQIEDRGFNGFVHTDVSTFGPFLPAGPEGGGVLVPGTMFPPNGRANRAMLRRGSNWIQANALTSGLPPGAYTMWWVIFNNPSSCISPIPGLSLCGEADLGNPAAETSIFWADGNIVTANGLGAFSAQVAVGDDLGTPGQQHVFGPGLTNAQGAEVHLIVKYHGPASEDPDVLHEQLTTLLGSCLEGANSIDFGPPFGIQCFDPQAAIFMP